MAKTILKFNIPKNRSKKKKKDDEDKKSVIQINGKCCIR